MKMLETNEDRVYRYSQLCGFQNSQALEICVRLHKAFQINQRDLFCIDRFVDSQFESYELLIELGSCQNQGFLISKFKKQLPEGWSFDMWFRPKASGISIQNALGCDVFSMQHQCFEFCMLEAMEYIREGA